MYTTKITAQKIIADGTMVFYFQKPAGFQYTAGQYVDLTLSNPLETDADGDRRSFSLSSAAQEPELFIATRMRDTAFKRVLKSMPVGSVVQISEPMGSFTIHNNAEKPAVFLAGGIGITPFYSMVKDAAYRKLPHHITLFYSNKRPEDSAFLQELIDLQKENSNYKLVATMTEMDKSKQSWTGETGFITKEILDKHLKAKETNKAIYYIAGPPAMVAAMRNMLNESGVDTDNIRTEEFSGY